MPSDTGDWGRGGEGGLHGFAINGTTRQLKKTSSRLPSPGQLGPEDAEGAPFRTDDGWASGRGGGGGAVGLVLTPAQAMAGVSREIFILSWRPGAGVVQPGCKTKRFWGGVGQRTADGETPRRVG